MNRRATVLTFLAVSALGSFGVGADTSGCQSVDSSTVKTESIRTAYWLFYKTDEDAAYARAQFRVGSEIGTTLELTGASKVDFDDQPLAWNALLDWHEKKIAGRVTTGTWAYTDNEGKTFENALTPSLEARLPASFPKELPATASYDLVWEGPALQEGETMEAIAAHDANRFQFIAVFEKNVGAKNIVLTKEDLGKLPRGRTAIVLQRHRDTKLTEGTASGGKITTTFECASASFDLL